LFPGSERARTLAAQDPVSAQNLSCRKKLSFVAASVDKLCGNQQSRQGRENVPARENPERQ